MKKIVICGTLGLDEKTQYQMTDEEHAKYLRFQEVLEQLQILKKLLPWEIVNKIQSIGDKRTYILTIRESFNNMVYTYSNCVYNLLEIFLPKRIAREEANKIYKISEVNKIIEPKKGIRQLDVHISSKNRYYTWAYFGTTSGIDNNTKLSYLKRTRKECIDEMNNIYRKIIHFSRNILKKIDKEIGKRH